MQLLPQSNIRKMSASARNRTQVNCLEGSYAHHYTTDALMMAEMKLPKTPHSMVIFW